jgi:hypothetical protein
LVCASLMSLADFCTALLLLFSNDCALCGATTLLAVY